MKKTLLSLYRGGEISRVPKTINEKFKALKKGTITDAEYKAHAGAFEFLTSELVSSIKAKNKTLAMKALKDLRWLYRKYGIQPTDASRGCYEMLSLLDEIAEFVTVVASGRDTKWKEK